MQPIIKECFVSHDLVSQTETLQRAAAAVAQWVRAFVPQAEGWVFESQP